MGTEHFAAVKSIGVIAWWISPISHTNYLSLGCQPHQGAPRAGHTKQPHSEAILIK